METAITLSIQGNPAYLRYAVISIGNLIRGGINPKDVYLFIQLSLMNRDECVELSHFGINIIYTEFVSKFIAIDYICSGFQYKHVLHLDVDCSYSGEDINKEIKDALVKLYERDSVVIAQSQRKTKLSCSEILTDRLRLFKGAFKNNAKLISDLIHCITFEKNSYDDFVNFLTDEELWIYGGMILVNINKYKKQKHIVNILDYHTHCDETVLMFMYFLNRNISNYFSRYDFGQRVCDYNLNFGVIMPGFNHFASVEFRKNKEREINDEYLKIKELFKINKI